MRNQILRLICILLLSNLADIYVIEFYRLWNPYAFREWAASKDDTSAASPQFIKPNDSWCNIYYGDT
jgi:hypothetical protein